MPKVSRRKKIFRHSSKFYRRINELSKGSTSNGSNNSLIDCAGTSGTKDKNNVVENTICNAITPPEPQVTSKPTFDEEKLLGETEKQEMFSEKLSQWALSHRINHMALTDLLRLLKNEGLDVPGDSRTLLSTPRSCVIVPMGNGQFWYNGIKRNLISSLAKMDIIETVSLIFNIDGLPPFKSSSVEFWPILLKVHELPLHQPIVVAIYCGESKPPLQEFLQQFVSELHELLENGIEINNTVLNVKIKYFVCDTPARSFIKGTVGFNSAHGCIKCTVIGEYDKGGRHMSFPKVNCPLRTDDSFRRALDEDHHKEESPLIKLPINMVEDIIIADSLHLLDLGVMRKCLYGWVYGNYNFKTKLSGKEINLLSDKLKLCNKTKPAEIHRTVRPLKCLKNWKGTEFRTFILYLGPVVLKDFLSGPVYHNYLLLFCASTILSCKAYLKHISIAETLILEFIKTFGNLYGFDAISSNVHNLIHVVNDVKKFGPLSEISAYPFENFLSQIKLLVRTGNRPLQQIVKRVSELQHTNTNLNFSKLHRSYPYVKYETTKPTQLQLSDCNKAYTTVYVSDRIMLSNKTKNMWFLTKSNSVVKLLVVTYCKEKICVYGKSLNNYRDFFDLPIRSSRFNIYQCQYKNKNNYNKPELYSLNEIKCKLFALEYNDHLVFFPLLHTVDMFLFNFNY